MRELMVRYLDGELDEEEALRFIEALEHDACLAAELHAHERIQAAGHSLGGALAPSGFADRLMAKLHRMHHVSASRRTMRLPSLPVWAAAAVVVFAFGLGRVTTFLSRGVPALSPQQDLTLASSISAEPIAFVSQSGEGQNLRLVQITYAPSSPDAERVTLAGTFNGWNANQVPMRQKDGVWTVVLVLPPGSYEYMFIEDGERWVTDPLAPITRDDGFGGRNAVLHLGV